MRLFTYKTNTIPNLLGLLLGVGFRQCTNPSHPWDSHCNCKWQPVCSLVLHCAMSVTELLKGMCRAPKGKNPLRVFILHKKGITTIVTFLLVELLLGGRGVVLVWASFHTSFYSQENKMRREQLEKNQKKLQAVHGNEMSPPWRPPGKVTYSNNYWAFHCFSEQQIVHKVLSVASNSFVTSWFLLNPL